MAATAHGGDVQDGTDATPEGQGTTPTRKRAQIARQPVTYSCGGCATRWGGVSRCHCSGCHRTFAGLDGFDAHRRDVRGVGTCLDPAGITDKDGEPRYAFRDDLWRSTREFTGAGQLFAKDEPA